ncbi:MAG TPA: hypothetical protein VD772_06160 [Anseongella sp.]|nr:hypothetical protein [Anseongella sp.]
MIEVFKTNVRDRAQAARLLRRIHRSFAGYEANFDLDDCDNILRVKCHAGLVQPASLVRLLAGFGVRAEVLTDDHPPLGGAAFNSNKGGKNERRRTLPGIGRDLQRTAAGHFVI